MKPLLRSFTALLFLSLSLPLALHGEWFDGAEAEIAYGEDDQTAYVYTVTYRVFVENEGHNNEMWYRLGERELTLEARWWADPHFEKGDRVAVLPITEWEEGQFPDEAWFLPVETDENGELKVSYSGCNAKRRDYKTYLAE